MIKNLLVGLIRLYQLCFSPLLRSLPIASSGCRFTPTCSEYARQAISIHGPARGVALTAKRLGRCHPFCCGGHDPIPSK